MPSYDLRVVISKGGFEVTGRDKVGFFEAVSFNGVSYFAYVLMDSESG